MKPKKKDWSALPERSEADVKRLQQVRSSKTPRLRGPVPLGPYTKKAAKAMAAGRRKEEA